MPTMDKTTVVYLHVAAHDASALFTLATVPYTRPCTTDVEFAGNDTVQPSDSATLDAGGHVAAPTRARHSAHAERKLHVGSAAVTLHADADAGPSVNLATVTLYVLATGGRVGWVVG
jgi:hypothetical protein